MLPLCAYMASWTDSTCRNTTKPCITTPHTQKRLHQLLLLWRRFILGRKVAGCSKSCLGNRRGVSGTTPHLQYTTIRDTVSIV